MRISRRNFLRAESQHPTQAALPWQFGSQHLLTACENCNRCAEACPTNIIKFADKGLPYVDFKLGACELCRDCVESCPEDYFTDQIQPPWYHKVQYTADCIAFQAVYCRTCKDLCTENAIQFEFETIASGLPKIDIDACNGCGACISTCPNDAIQLI